ncbi:MlaD family protein [Marinigracilibium pacificum]|uniref:MCE family protein n=1 Tax=Marinigracilibium pacificum TaxID=2729599 RepID=A0A848J333_9BACT|nr:MlaD family protein [Marinigracilibium pacificum]NMM49915.1 MCE family protein [Marinigracilibium pacificum]
MTNRLLMSILVLLFVTACFKNEKTIYLKTSKVNGLTTESIVTVKDFQIGEVDDISMNNEGEIIIKLNLDETPRLATDTRFNVESRDLLGTKGISVTLGKGDEYYQSGDTINLIETENSFQLDSMIEKGKNYIKDLIGE